MSAINNRGYGKVCGNWTFHTNDHDCELKCEVPAQDARVEANIEKVKDLFETFFPQFLVQLHKQDPDRSFGLYQRVDDVLRVYDVEVPEEPGVYRFQFTFQENEDPSFKSKMQQAFQYALQIIGPQRREEEQKWL